MAVTLHPQHLRRTPRDDAVSPLPMPEMTPPETRTNFGRGLGSGWESMIGRGVEWGRNTKTIALSDDDVYDVDGGGDGRGNVTTHSTQACYILRSDYDAKFPPQKRRD